MNDIQKQIQALERKSSSKEEVEKLNQNVATQTQQLLKSNADTAVASGRADDQDGAARGEARGHEPAPLSALAADRRDPGRPTAPAQCAGRCAGRRDPHRRAPPGSPPRRGGRPAPSPAELYDTAYADYTKGRYALAIQGFEDYLASYPSTDLSDNAQYWIGESHFAQKKYPGGDRRLREAPQAVAGQRQGRRGLLKKGYALLELSQKAEAVVQLQYVIHEFPTSEEARLAHAKLKSLGVDAK